MTWIGETALSDILAIIILLSFIATAVTLYDFACVRDEEDD